jgi:hypothetical protein
MKATKAYIASLGTTGVLLAASILMLAVVSAVVAFDRWPGANAATPIKTLVLTDKAPPIQVSAQAAGSSATPAARGTTGGGTSRPSATHNAGGVAGERITGGTRTPAVTPGHSTPSIVPAVPKPLQPVEDTTTPIFDTISNPGTTAGQLADGTQALTNDAGVSVGRVSPDVGSTVVSTGDAAAQAVRQLPLPDHVIPGH